MIILETYHKMKPVLMTPPLIKSKQGYLQPNMLIGIKNIETQIQTVILQYQTKNIQYKKNITLY
jgi:hypothetical protein